MAQRVAILIGNGRYLPESQLADLSGPANDVREVSKLLADSRLASFTVREFVDFESYKLQEMLETTLTEAQRDDLVLLYYSGHGKLDPAGQLCLTTANTRLDRLRSTSLHLPFLRSLIDDSRSNQVVLVLDCCFSGAAGKAFLRSAVEDQLALAQGTGRYILTSATSIQTSREREHDEGGEVLGDFTRCMVEGISSGLADTDNDGRITLGELRDYLQEHLRGQSPRYWGLATTGDVVIALNPDIKPGQLPKEVQEALNSPLSYVREGAVRALADLQRSNNPGLALAARNALERALEDDSRGVSAAAARALGRPPRRSTPQHVPTQLPPTPTVSVPPKPEAATPSPAAPPPAPAPAVTGPVKPEVQPGTPAPAPTQEALVRETGTASGAERPDRPSPLEPGWGVVRRLIIVEMIGLTAVVACLALLPYAAGRMSLGSLLGLRIVCGLTALTGIVLALKAHRRDAKKLVRFALSGVGLAAFVLSGRIAGRVTDQASGESLAGVRVTIPEYAVGASARETGRFSIPLVPPGWYQVQFQYIGYRADTVSHWVPPLVSPSFQAQLAPVAVADSVTPFYRPQVRIWLTLLLAVVIAVLVLRWGAQALAQSRRSNGRVQALPPVFRASVYGLLTGACVVGIAHFSQAVIGGAPFPGMFAPSPLLFGLGILLGLELLAKDPENTLRRRLRGVTLGVAAAGVVEVAGTFLLRGQVWAEGLSSILFWCLVWWLAAVGGLVGIEVARRRNRSTLMGAVVGGLVSGAIYASLGAILFGHGFYFFGTLIIEPLYGITIGAWIGLSQGDVLSFNRNRLEKSQMVAAAYS